MKDRLLLALYLGAVISATLVHQTPVLAAGALLVLISAGPKISQLLWRTVRAALPFALAVSLGYVLVAHRQGLHAGPTLLLINTRVVLLLLLAFRVLPLVDLQQAFGFSRTLRFILILTMSQVLTFKRLFADFRWALTSRSPRRVNLLTALRHGAATCAWFIRRAEHDATEITQALDARGFFLDRD